jgi:hypothetical protein
MKDSKHDELLCEKWKVKKKESNKKREKKGVSNTLYASRGSKG